ncbi:MAG: NAD(+)/NADH kinase [Pseudomonadales bacterium]|nr:NAD(+)/NADH kinase [Pseudomonadales bacterium]MCP5185156.1 NAD(+)/NADH kinase [Pseudomonadales bacterium]
MGIIGIVANPASGKDVRRLVARASVFDNQEKQAIVRRLLVGATQAGRVDILYMADAHGIVSGALRDQGIGHATALPSPETSTAYDTITAAREMRTARCNVVVTLGGDGTNRAFALGWRDPYLIPISTGTNNVFPILSEATVAGAAAGLIATGKLDAQLVSAQHKAIRVMIEGERDDIALIDAVFCKDRFVGARALLDPDSLSLALLTRAEPAAVGMTTLGGLLRPMGGGEDSGLLLRLDANASTRINAPIAPGYYREVGIQSHRVVGFAEEIVVEGPGVLAFDGERERRLLPGQKAFLTLSRTGPKVINVPLALRRAAEAGLFSINT